VAGNEPAASAFGTGRFTIRVAGSRNAAARNALAGTAISIPDEPESFCLVPAAHFEPLGRVAPGDRDMGYNFPSHITDSYFYFVYPFLVDVPGYRIRVHGVSAEERERNLEMLRFASSEAVARSHGADRRTFLRGAGLAAAAGARCPARAGQCARRDRVI